MFGGATDGDPEHDADMPRVDALPSDVQRIARQQGFKYNVKVVLRGAAGTGKSALLQRLLGKSLADSYVPTTCLTAGSVRWAARGAGNATDMVKIDVWDVVDVGTPLAPGNSTSGRACAPRQLPAMAVDATTIDVYRGCHAAIILVDVTRRETLAYAARAVRDVPPNVHLCVCANFCDRGNDERQMSDEVVAALTLRETPALNGVFIAASMATGYGLRAINAYLAAPCLVLQVEAQEQLLARLRTELSAMPVRVASAQHAEQRSATTPGMPLGEDADGARRDSDSGSGSGNSASDTERVSTTVAVRQTKQNVALNEFFDDGDAAPTMPRAATIKSSRRHGDMAPLVHPS
jgi:GTPase SAR1 family protein